MKSVKLPVKINSSLKKWEREINQALTKGTGPWATEMCADLHDYLEIIKVAYKDRQEAGCLMQSMDTYPREAIPEHLYEYFVKKDLEYEKFRSKT